ncbi:hypothetical protein JOM56_007647 [Amanita muscaria]
MEHGNFSAAAGFDFDPEDFGIFSTFSRWSFQREKVGYSSHSNTLSYLPRLIDGINNIAFSWLCFPVDPAQMIATIECVFFQKGLRFVNAPLTEARKKGD